MARMGQRYRGEVWPAWIGWERRGTRGLVLITGSGAAIRPSASRRRWKRSLSKSGLRAREAALIPERLPANP